MENKPLKHRGFRQGLHQTSSVAKETLGQVRHDGQRSFRYAKAGAGALTAGNLNLMPALSAYHVIEAITAAVPIGTLQLTLTVSAGAAILENALKGGYFQIETGTGGGHQYMIDGNSAITSSGTTIYIALEEPGIQVALDTTSRFNLAASPQYMVVETATDEAPAGGVPLVDVPIAYYFWNQVSGVAMVLQSDSAAVGTTMIVHAGAGACVSTGWSDVDVPVIGVKVSAAAVGGTYGPVDLCIL